MKMSQPTQTNPNPDDLLADFTDRVLDGKTSVLASPEEEELRALEQTILRLHQAVPKSSLDEKTFKRMQADFKVRARKAGSSSKPAWQSQTTRQRLVLAFAAIVVVVAIFISLPFLTSNPGSVQGTAGVEAQGIILLAAAVCIVVLIFWLGRRK